MFVEILAVDGIPQAGYARVLEAKSISETKAVAFLQTQNLLENATEISDLEYLAHWWAGIVRTDKSTIIADGLDTATVTAEVHPDLTEITFYHADTGEVIATVPVDPATRIATLQVTATTPRVIKIRAGEPTITRLNEVVINAT